MDKRVTILNFSHRDTGNCGKIAKFVSEFHMRTNVFVYKMEMQPCRNCNYECLKQGEICPQITPEQQKIMDAVCESDLVYFIVPNFCGYPCANYFAFNERSVGYFHMDRSLLERYMAVEKRFIVVSNSEGAHFSEAFQQQTNKEPVILYMKSGKYRKRSIAGDMLDAPEAVADLLEFLNRTN